MYLDHAATSGGLAAEALARMREVMAMPLGNPSSAHLEGRTARKVLRQAREEAAEAIGASPDEIVFTSGVTEGLHLAIHGLLAPVGTGCVVTSRYDHKAVVNALRATGREVVQIELDEEPPENALMVFAAVNNELGWTHDLSRREGSPLIADCAQAALYAPEIWALPNVTAISLPSHKIGGPTGAGLLVLRAGRPFITTMRGGPQEHEVRAGTEAVVNAAGFARRLSTLLKARAETLRRLEVASEAFKTALKQQVRGVKVVSDERPHAPGILSLQVVGVGARSLVEALDGAGVAISSKSACGAYTSDTIQLSFNNRERALETFRVSFHYHVTEDEAVHAAHLIATAARRLRGEV